MTKAETRRAIRGEADRLGCRYRITAAGEVHFYGVMPNTNTIGWWFFAWTPAEAIAWIEEGANDGA